MKAVRTILALTVSLVIVGNLSAAEERRGPEGKHPRQAMMERWAVLNGVDLTDDQKAKVEEVKKEYGPKFKEARGNRDSMLTEDQQKARDEAVQAAKAAGKRGEEVRMAAKAAVTLTDEQKAKMADVRKDVQALRKEAREKIMAILTPEQKEQLKKPHEGMRSHSQMGRGGEMFDGLNLTDEQKARIAEIRKEYAPKLQEAGKDLNALRKEVHEKVLACLTPEQKEQLKQKREQRKEPKPEGK
jgi:Spy/CpxP family protein refolding chaperone